MAVPLKNLTAGGGPTLFAVFGEFPGICPKCCFLCNITVIIKVIKTGMMTYQLLPTGEGARPLKNMTGGGRPTLFAVFGDFRQNGPATTFFPNKLRLSFKF